MLRAARKELGLASEETIVIGDTMDTDILGGVQLNFKTILVLSGGTRREDLAKYAFRPDKIVDSIADLDHDTLSREFASGSISAKIETELAVEAPKTKRRARRRRLVAVPIAS
jgi:NagD protein